MICRAILAFSVLTTALPVVADTYPRQRGIDIENYRFELTLSDDTDEIRGSTTIAVRFLTAGVESLTLDLIGKDSEETQEGMEVTGVRWTAPRKEAAYRFENDKLTIDTPSTSTAGATAHLQIDYRGKAATGLIIAETKHGDRSFFSDNWPIKARHWLPTIDHPYDKATSEMVVTAPAHYQVVSNGLLIEETDLGHGRRLTHWRQSVPIPVWLNALGVAHFAVQHPGEVDGIPIQTWAFAQDRDAGFFDFAVPTPRALEFFADHIGSFSYEKLANVQSNSVRGGMEAASAIFYGDDSVTGERTERWRNVIVHELAHQWWGNSVTQTDWDDVWLSEGFATYFTTLFVEHAYGRDEMVKLLESGRDRIFDFAEENPDYHIVHDNLDDMSRVTTGNIYQKGGWTLHMLRELIGDEAFWTGIRKYYARHQNGNATTADFRAAMEEASVRDLEWFFDQWLHRGGALEIDGAWSWAEGDGILSVILDQVQPNALPYRTSLDLEITDADGGTEIVEVDLEALCQEFAIGLEFEPVTLVLDPGLKVLGRWTLRRGPAEASCVSGLRERPHAFRASGRGAVLALATLSSEEIDAQVWDVVSATVAANDIDGMASTYHPDAILVSSTGTVAIAEQMVKWGEGMDRIRAEGRSASVSFRFASRQDGDTTAFESGIFRYAETDGEGVENPQFVPFEALLVKKHGSWLILMERQLEATDEGAWNELDSADPLLSARFEMSNR